ncbi:hypothetical protein ACJX0J_024607, partial [Zea mays]
PMCLIDGAGLFFLNSLVSKIFIAIVKILLKCLKGIKSLKLEITDQILHGML